MTSCYSLGILDCILLPIPYHYNFHGLYLFTIFSARTLVRLPSGLYMINPFLHSLTLYCILQVKLIHQLICSIELLLYLLEAFPHTTDNVCPLDIPSTGPSSSTHTVRAVSYTFIPHSAKIIKYTSHCTAVNSLTSVSQWKMCRHGSRYCL